jgi:hypothetical protein
MKASIIITILITILFMSCERHPSSKDLSGTYVMKTQGEYAIDYDTLIISLDKSSSNTYSIKNNTGFEKIRNGVTKPKEFKKTTWIATWDEDKQVLSETDLGRQIQFKDNGFVLVLKNSTYQKIK